MPQQRPKVINCASCGRPLKKIKRYYRDDKYWCDKTCWRKSKKTE